MLQGFKRSDNEHTLYKKVVESSDVLLVCIYVDDMVCFSSSIDLINEFKLEIRKKFDMTDEKGMFITLRK